VSENYCEGDGGAGFSIYIPLLQCERDTPSRRLDVSPEAEARCSALALSTFLDGSEEENDAGAPATAGSRFTQQATISVMGPASGFYEKWLLVKAVDTGNLIGCGIKHLGDAAGYPFSVVQKELSGSSWLKGLIDKRARGDTPVAQFDGPDELELELIQSHMAQKPVLRGEVGCACVAREVGVERGGMGERGCARRLGGWVLRPLSAVLYLLPIVALRGFAASSLSRILASEFSPAWFFVQTSPVAERRSLSSDSSGPYSDPDRSAFHTPPPQWGDWI